MRRIDLPKTIRCRLKPTGALSSNEENAPTPEGPAPLLACSRSKTTPTVDRWLAGDPDSLRRPTGFGPAGSRRRLDQNPRPQSGGSGFRKHLPADPQPRQIQAYAAGMNAGCSNCLYPRKPAEKTKTAQKANLPEPSHTKSSITTATTLNSDLNP